jgi:DNA-binding CsgD family transcriptional regulator
MTADPFARVTEAQRECLRLVRTQRNSKEIAQQLGISPFTVDKRLARAIATLGVTSRFEAARLLSEHEQEPAYERLAYQTTDIVPPDQTVEVAGSEELTSVGGDRGAQIPWLPLRPQGGRHNSLTVWQRLAWIGMIPAGLAVAVGMLGFALSVTGKLLQLLRSVLS